MKVEEVLDKGFSAHANVKSRLKRIIKGEEEATPESVKADNLCIIGEWIYGPGKEYEGLSEFQNLKEIHKNFHLAAHDALCLHRDGNEQAAMDYVETGPFEERSKEIKTAIFELKSKVK